MSEKKHWYIVFTFIIIIHVKCSSDSGFLNLNIIDTLRKRILCCKGLCCVLQDFEQQPWMPVICTSNPAQLWQQKCLYTLSIVFCGDKINPPLPELKTTAALSVFFSLLICFFHFSFYLPHIALSNLFFFANLMCVK